MLVGGLLPVYASFMFISAARDRLRRPAICAVRPTTGQSSRIVDPSTVRLFRCQFFLDARLIATTQPALLGIDLARSGDATEGWRVTALILVKFRVSQDQRACLLAFLPGDSLLITVGCSRRASLMCNLDHLPRPFMYGGR